MSEQSKPMSRVEEMRLAAMKAAETAREAEEEAALAADPANQRKRPISPKLEASARAAVASAQEIKKEETEAGGVTVEFSNGELSEKERPIGAPPEEKDNTRYSGAAYDTREVRLAIEGRCTPISFSELITTGRVVQRVPILVGKLEVEFQSLRGEEHWWISKMGPDKSDYGLIVGMWGSYAELVMSLKSLNGRQYDRSWDSEKRHVDVAGFNLKWDAIMGGLSRDILAILMVNLGWFNSRVQALYKNDFENLKNG